MSKAKENYAVGQVYEFKVKKKFTSQTELIDETSGINAYLHDTQNIKLFKGQIVKCRVTGYSTRNNRPIVELVDLEEFAYTSGLTLENLENILENEGLAWADEKFTTLLLTDENEETFDEQMHEWISSLIENNIDLQQVRTDCANLLELSGLLDISGNAQREFYQQRLTELIESIGYYIEAGKLIEKGEQESFIDTLYNKLSVSGFIYHPDKNLNILACLFMRRPEIMRRRIAELLKIICKRDISIWKKEPFNSTLCKLLEIYIHECVTKIDREKGEEKSQLINNIITSLTVQLQLAANSKESEVVDTRLTTARLCAIASYINQGDATRLLNNAYSYLFYDDIRYLKIPIDSVDNAHYILANFNPDGEIDAPSQFSNGVAKLYVDKEGISLRPASDDIVTYPVFAADSGLWKNMQVHLTSRTSQSVYLMSDNLRSFRDIWIEIENDLFNSTGSATARRKKHHVGDEVMISFVKQDLFERSKFICRIEDEIGGKGYIYISDIVPYTVNGATLNMFFGEGGVRLRYPARIIDVDADGQFHFSMGEILKEESAEYYLDEAGNAADDILCRLGKAPHPRNGLAPAVSKEGLSVSLTTPQEYRELNAGAIVRCRFIGSSRGTTHIDCEVVEPVNDFAHDFDVTEAFAHLMSEFGDVPDGDQADSDYAEEDENAVLEGDKELDEDYVRQVIHCIDRLAMLDTDYIMAYNYLAFARLLCRLIAWDSQAVYYKGRMDIISMLHYFDKNNEVDEDELSQLEMANAQLFETNKPLQERFMQLQAVSYIGKPEHTSELYALSERSPLLRTLCQLVIAYNIVNELDMKKEAVSIHEKIKDLLNLKGLGSKLKKYGIESETVEFKTSFIHAPKDSEQSQKETILQVIDSFLNTSGGVLYIGVNDGGRGVGIENDLQSAPYYNDKEKYVLDVTNSVKLEFGRKVAPFVKVYFDPQNSDKDVLIVEVSKYPQKVPMKNGSYFLRTNSSKEGYTREELEEVLKGLAVSDADAEIADIDVSDDILEPEKEISSSTENIAAAPAVERDTIATSRIRQNVLESYLDDYVDPMAFLKFIEPNELVKLSRYDYDYDSPLTLTVLHDEAKGYLILGYENGCIVKVPLDEIVELDNDSVRKRYDGAKLIFASIAQGDDDLVLTVFKENKSNASVVVRADKVGGFDAEQLQDYGSTPCNSGLIGEIIAFDVIPAAMADDFAPITGLDATRAGHTLNDSARMRHVKRRIEEFKILDFRF